MAGPQIPQTDEERLQAAQLKLAQKRLKAKKEREKTSPGFLKQPQRMGVRTEDPDFSLAGVQDPVLRAAVSAGDTPEEQEMRLAEIVGEGGFTRDRFGNLALTPKGLAAIGQEDTTGSKGVLLDEPGLTFSDFADLRGVAPEIAGGVVAGMATGGMGLIPAIAATAAGSGLGKGFDELIESMLGYQLQSPGGIAGDVGVAAAEGAIGEGIFRGILAPIGRKILRPNESATGFFAPKIREGGKELAREAAEIGVRPQISNLQNRALVNRISGVVQQIFGDSNAARNAGAFNREVVRLRRLFNAPYDDFLQRFDVEQIGKNAIEDEKALRLDFGEAARAKFALSDEILQGQPVIPTESIKNQARKLLDALPKQQRIVKTPAKLQGLESLTPEARVAQAGRPILKGEHAAQELEEIMQLPDLITAEQLQGIRNELFQRLDFGTNLPGVGHRDASLLLESADAALDNAILQLPENVSSGSDVILYRQAIDQLSEARDFYKRGIQKFKKVIVERLAKDPDQAGYLDPEVIVEQLFQPNRSSKMKDVLNVVSSETGEQIKAAAMERVLKSAMKRSDDPLVGFEFDGKGLIKALDNYGVALKTTFGEETTKDLYRLARAIQSATRQKGKTSGSIVAAGIAVNPLKNIGRLAKLAVLGKVFSSKSGQRWLIEGFEAETERESLAALTRLALQIKQHSADWELGVSFSDEGQE